MSTTGLTRRRFVVGGTVAAGYALAAQPVSADTIVTDTDGLLAGDIEIPTEDGTIPGYRARPQAPGKVPVVIVVHEIFGLHEYIRDICRRLAKRGYLGIAPDLFQRQGDVTKIRKIPDIIDEVVSKVPDAQVLADLDATVAWAEASGEGDMDRLGITGFCWGGRLVWVYAAHNPKVRTGGAWYGRLAATGPGVLTEIGVGRDYPLDIV